MDFKPSEYDPVYKMNKLLYKLKITLIMYISKRK